MVKWDITRDSGSRVVGSNPARRVIRSELVEQVFRTIGKFFCVLMQGNRGEKSERSSLPCFV